MPGLYVLTVNSPILMRMACGENIIVAENERTAPVFEVRGSNKKSKKDLPQTVICRYLSRNWYS